MKSDVDTRQWLWRGLEIGLIIALAGLPFSRAIASIGTGIAIGAWVLLTLVERRWLGPGWVITGWLLALIAWHAASILSSQVPSESLDGAGKVLKYTALFAAASVLAQDPRRLNRVLGMWLASTTFIALDGIVQWITGVDLLRQHHILYDETPLHMTASFLTGNDFGAYLIVAILAWGGWLVASQSRWKWLIGPGAVILLGYCLYQTGSRGAWLSLVLACLAWQALRSVRSGVITAVALAMVIILLPQPAKAHLAGIVHFREGTSYERMVLWGATVRMIQDHPIRGHGSNTYNMTIGQYKPASYPDIRYAHNCYLQMTAEVGLLGLGLFLGFLTTWGWKSFLRLRGGDLRLQGLFWGLVALLLHSAVDTHLYSLPLATLCWLMGGIVWGHVARQKQVACDK